MLKQMDIVKNVLKVTGRIAEEWYLCFVQQSGDIVEEIITYLC